MKRAPRRASSRPTVKRPKRSPAAARAPKKAGSLATLRAGLGRTQGELAARAGMTQGEVSRLEHQQDLRLSTLERYAAALGAKVEIHLLFPNGKKRPLLLPLG